MGTKILRARVEEFWNQAGLAVHNRPWLEKPSDPLLKQGDVLMTRPDFIPKQASPFIHLLVVS